MKKVLVLLVVLLACSQLFAGDFFTYASLRSSGAASGGLRYVLNDNVCFDAAVGGSYNDGVNADVYVDAFLYKLAWGVGAFTTVPNGGDVETTAMLLYCFEKSIAKDIYIDITPILVSKTFVDGAGVDVLSGWDIAIVFGL